jgi:pimeloyl-ACP methyl ester carboxylesterase
MERAITQREQAEIDRANESGRRPVVFVHGLWLLAESWDPWRRLFEEHGYATLAPGWPDDPELVEEARRNPEIFAHKGVQQITDHFVAVIHELRSPPAIIGHSFGGLIAQKLAGMGLATATVAIDPVAFRGVLALPLSALKAAWPVLRTPANYKRAITLSFAQFRYAFANAVGEDEAKALYEKHSVAGSGVPLFQAASANLHPSTEARVDTGNPKRGPLLIVAGEKDNTIPFAIANASYQRQRKNPGVTELREIKNRGHSLTIDSGWREVAEVALAFVEQHPPSRERAAAREEPRPQP